MKIRAFKPQYVLCALANETAIKCSLVNLLIIRLYFNYVLSKIMEQLVFAFALIIDGTTEKVLQFVMPLKSIYSQNLGFIEQMVNFCTPQRGSNKKNSIIDIFLS